MPLAILALLLMLAASLPRAASPQSGYVTVDFDNVDLRVFIKFVSETTGRIFILDERVKGTVSIVFANQIPIDELDTVLESVLEVKGYAAIPAGPVTKIVPLNSAKQRGVEVGVTRPGRTGNQP
jgi:general secretion pathway protein D